MLTKRSERIYRYILEEQVVNGEGLTTNEIASSLEIQRSNVSKDLNLLVREKRLVKTTGRPVRYLIATQEKSNHQLSGKISQPFVEERMVRNENSESKRDIFSHFIGVHGSMKNAIEQAKAAIMYPPNGLNCLITGPTGSGKTFFAHSMFQFAQVHQVIEEEKELIIFNCADYANNPELLMSHLFGYAKGAFTGADEEKAGVIDQADGSILFLDEIHRLPPEGQEMIFYFMDHGLYNRLGETGKKRQADVRIIGATTEDPHSTLLDTFIRRIPISIQMPSFEQRSGAEKIELVKMLIAHEANRIERRISLTEDVVKALIGSTSFGNIGQLKSNIQLACARGFLNHMNQEQIDITIDDLPEGIRSGLIVLTNKRNVLKELSQYLEAKIIIDPSDNQLKFQMDTYELPYNLYDVIGGKAALLKQDGIDQESINHFISTDINVHLKTFYKNHGFSFYSENKLVEFVDEKIIEMTNEIASLAEKRLRYKFEQNFVYAMSLHISSFLKKIKIGEQRQIDTNIREMVKDYPDEFEFAQEICDLISKRFSIHVPVDEAYYLAVLLISLKTTPPENKIGIVVATHGESTATSMVNVVKQLLGVEQILAVDMPLDMPPKVALEQMKRAVCLVNEGSGVLLLVDMGSLAMFQREIQRETKVPIRTIDMVTTPIVLEAARKASVLGTSLEELYHSLRDFQGYTVVEELMNETENRYLPKAIVAICASGKGVAQQIKNLIESALQKKQISDIKVVTLSVVQMKEQLPTIQERYQVLATTGIVNPNLSAPFISLEKFIQTDLDELLEKLLRNQELPIPEKVAFDDQQVRTTCIEFLERSVTFLNPRKFIDVLWQVMEEIFHTWSIDSSDDAFKINLILHLAGMIERVLLSQQLTGTEEEIKELEESAEYPKLHLLMTSFSRRIHLEISPIEEYYIWAMIHKKIH